MSFFQKSKNNPEPEPEPKKATAPEPPAPKHPKPKILLLDLPELASKTLLERGFNVNVGTLGKPYKVRLGSGLEPLIGKAQVPNYTEQEVVIADLGYGECDPMPAGEKHRPDGEKDIWGKCDMGFLDPRVRTACIICKAFDRTLANGGVFVLFADQKTHIELHWGQLYRHGHFDGKAFNHDVWSLLSDLDDFEVTNDHGEEMRAKATTSDLGRVLAEFLPSSRYNCTLVVPTGQKGWEILAESKFNRPVAACRCLGKAGTVIILPQIADKPGLVSKLFDSVLPELSPHLFPDIEKGRWLHRVEYELPQVNRLKAQQTEIEEQAKKEIANIEIQIAQERAQAGWMQNLLTGTDAELVDAVKRALATIGFTSVIDVDATRDAEAKSRREDLQIHEQSPLVVIDVKGIGGCPRDEDALQAAKHASMRMRELNRTDIIALTICNHQRHIPPLDRDPNPFRAELIVAAEEQVVGLMSAWDLYRLLTNFKKFGWKSEHVKPLFYQKGRIHLVPTHYTYCGTMAHVWKAGFGVITEAEVRIGDKIAVEFDIEFEEAPVTSIHVEDHKVEIANPSDKTGLLWPAEMPKLREGMRVFRWR